MLVKVFRGDTWQRAWIVSHADGSPVDMAGAQARLHVRAQNGSLILSASTADGRITITPAQGRVDLIVPFSATEVVPPGIYRFDLEVTLANGTRRTIEQADLVVMEDMSRD